MSLITYKAAGAKKPYTREEDEKIIAMRNQGKSVKEISGALDRSGPSVQYRVGKLSDPALKSLDELHGPVETVDEAVAKKDS